MPTGRTLYRAEHYVNRWLLKLICVKFAFSCGQVLCKIYGQTFAIVSQRDKFQIGKLLTPKIPVNILCALPSIYTSVNRQCKHCVNSIATGCT